MGMQILQEPNSAWGNFGAGLGQGVSQAVPSIADMIMSRKKQQEFIKSLQLNADQTNSLSNELPKGNDGQKIADLHITPEKILSAPKEYMMPLAQIYSSQQKNFEKEREYHSARSEKYLEEVDKSRGSLRQKEGALQSIEASIQNMPKSGLSKDYLAEVTGFEPLRSASGAQLKTGLKEFLLGNISRAGTRPNMWIEQQIGDMAAKIGRSKTANMTFVEMMKSEMNLEKKRLEIAGELEDKHSKNLGYVPKTISKEVDNLLRPYADQAQEELAYKLRRLYEQEEGSKSLEKMKKVPEGTPLTLEMASILMKKYPNKTDKELEKIAKQMGFKIPSSEFLEGQ